MLLERLKEFSYIILPFVVAFSQDEFQNSKPARQRI